jgi:hypothetical protein
VAIGTPDITFRDFHFNAGPRTDILQHHPNRGLLRLVVPMIEVQHNWISLPTIDAGMTQQIVTNTVAIFGPNPIASLTDVFFVRNFVLLVPRGLGFLLARAAFRCFPIPFVLIIGKVSYRLCRRTLVAVFCLHSSILCLPAPADRLVYERETLCIELQE